MSASIREPVRLSVNLSPEVAEALRTLAEKKGATISEIVRNAIATEKFLTEEQEKHSQVLIKEKDGSVKQLVLR
jgi:predicted transcriptional regulator